MFTKKTQKSVQSQGCTTVVFMIAQPIFHLAETPAWLAIGQMFQLLFDLAVILFLSPIAVGRAADVCVKRKDDHLTIEK